MGAGGGIALALAVQLADAGYEILGEVVVQAGGEGVGGLARDSVGVGVLAPFPGCEVFVGADGAVEQGYGVNALLEAGVELAGDGAGLVAGLDLDGDFFPVHYADLGHLSESGFTG